MKIKEMAHQTASLKFMAGKKAVFDASDPGTGKTYVEIMDFVRQHKKDGKAALVVCPKSLMRAAWANDVKKFAPHLRVVLCYANDRMDALNAPADVYVINVDGVKDLLKINAKKFWMKFGRLIIDESTAFKHHTSQRSKAMAKLSKHFEYRRCMSGTPSSNGICDLWHQYFILDGGKRLGPSYFGFRNACCTPTQNGPSAQHIKWSDKPGIELLVADLVKDITIRHKFEDCVDIPENHQYALPIQLSNRHMATYNELKETSLAILRETTITAINAAVLATKLLQAASGAVYDDTGGYSLVGTERYELALDLVEERQHTIVFYHWDHQLVEMEKEAKKRKLDYAVWDSDKPELEREFQEGKYQVLFAHPKSAGHGLTLTKGTATIWASPTYNLEFYLQGLKRVHRIGQTEKTETIVIIAEDTVDLKVWASLQAKNLNMSNLLTELEAV
jgi:SNF2 family DNA or RNA helicase